MICNLLKTQSYLSLSIFLSLSLSLSYVIYIAHPLYLRWRRNHVLLQHRIRFSFYSKEENLLCNPPCFSLSLWRVLHNTLQKKKMMRSRRESPGYLTNTNNCVISRRRCSISLHTQKKQEKKTLDQFECFYFFFFSLSLSLLLLRVSVCNQMCARVCIDVAISPVCVYLWWCKNIKCVLLDIIIIIIYFWS